MTSKDDDTLPLPGFSGFSQELSVDATVDEDFIPTSQPQSSGSPKVSKNSENSLNKSTEDLKCPVSDSRIDDTLPPEAVLNQSTLDNKSTDFIPDTETKTTKISYSNTEFTCKKKIFGTEDTFKLQSKQLWESEAARIPESPALETPNMSILNDTPTEILPCNPGKCEEAITEIIVNDSAETVDLEETPVKVKSSDSERVLQKFEASSRSDSFAERCEETQIFDNSSVLLLDNPEADCLNLDESGSGETTEKLRLQEKLRETKIEGKMNGFCSVSSPPFAVAHLPENGDAAETGGKISAENASFRQEVQMNSTSLEPNNSSIVTRKIEFKLSVSCFVTVNTKTNKVLQKIILNVNETPKPKPRPVHVETASESTSDKSKRYSTSSSGSVYSDKMGPFALPKRISAVSDQTDSSEEEFGSHRIKERRALERVPWSNEYLLPLKMDDIMLLSIENQELLKRPNIIPSPRKLKHKHCNGVNHLTEIIESSSSEQPSHCNLGSEGFHSSKTSPREPTNSEGSPGKETPESSEPPLEKSPEENGDVENIQNEAETEAVSQQCGGDPGGNENSGGAIVQEEPGTELPNEVRQVEEVTRDDEAGPATFCDGLPVFARWTLDKRYYSGVLCGSVKNERWEVKFDDGTCKNVRQDFIMPAAWLNVGALVFAITDEKYESGQIVDIRKGEEVAYVIELDAEKKEISVRISDLCLTDVMAGIVREKYKPLVATPRGKAEIDFDNVLSGKRFREQRTPLRPPTVQTGSSGARKKSSSRSRKEAKGLQSVKETPQNDDTERKSGGLKSENGHLVEDKVISADSPSGTEAGETPLRRSGGKDARKKGKPRSLSYEAEESRSGKKLNSWLAPDGTPIPGPSGVKFKKQKTKAKPEETESDSASKSKKSLTRSKGAQSTEKGKRKRKLDESVEDCIKKKSLKDEESQVRTRSRKG